MSTTHIALLRGINVGGRNVVPMAELRETLAQLGLANVRTYIQSGNVAFESRRAAGPRLGNDIRNAIEQRFGFAPGIHLVSATALRDALAQNPYAQHEADDKTVHVMFLERAPDTQALARAEALAARSERCALIGNVFYLYAPDGVARSKLLKGAEKALGVAATARNLRSCRKVLELATG